MKIPKPIASIFGKHDSLCCPVIFYLGRLISFTTEAKDRPHEFGGPLPLCKGIGSPKTHRLVLTLDLGSLGISLQSKSVPALLPLIFNFDLESLTTEYVAERRRLRFDHPDCLFGTWRAGENSALPYQPYPRSFRRRSLGVGLECPMDFKSFQKYCTPQGLRGSVDEPDMSGHLFVLVPPCEMLGVTMWGKEGDAEGCLCVFDINPKSGLIAATNQCT